jgi:hypothetical protein
MLRKAEMENSNNPNNLSTDECTIPPAISTQSLTNLLFKRDEQAERDIRSCVEWQANGESVEHAERVATEAVLGRRLEAWDVYTDKGRWWVITSPTNLYSQELFPSLDYTISFHVGVMARMMSEPDPGVSELEQSLMASAWRRWEQAAEVLDEAEEAEDFQAVGMRCRECLVAMVKSVAGPQMVPAEAEAPKRGDFTNWSELIADHIAHGDSAKRVRGYLKAVSQSGWQLVSWLTHASRATRADAMLAVDVTQHILATFSTALFRYNFSIPDRCARCGSYKIGLWAPDAGTESVLRCQACGALCDETPVDADEMASHPD